MLIFRKNALALAMMAACALTGCPDDVPVGPGVPQGGAATQADGKPLDLKLLSEHDSGSWSDMAIAADGTLHVVFSDTPKSDVTAVYHRASRDGGATWSTPQRISPREHHAGMPRVAIDGGGRVYAIWKDMSAHEGGWLAAGTGDSLAGGPYGRPLMASLLTGDSWSAPYQVSTSAQVVSWFSSVDPTGKLHVVWSEAIKAPTGAQQTAPAVVMQTSLDGSAVAAPQELYRGKPDVPEGYDGSAWYYETLLGLRGYVNAAGEAVFVATQLRAKADKNEIVRFENGAFKTLLSYDAYSAGIYYNPPELVLDAAGQEHLVVQDGKGERKGLLDFKLGGAMTPTPIRQAPEAAGEIKAAQVARGPKGQLAAMMSFKDRNDATTEFDLFVSRYENGAWTPAVNVTSNALREQYKEHGDNNNGTQVSTSYEPSFSAGAFDAEGRLNLALVNHERVSITQTATGTYLGDTVRATDGAVVAFPKVFFVRL